MQYLWILALIVGLIFYCVDLKNTKTPEIGRMLLFACFLSMLIATVPATVRMLHGG